MTSCAMGSPPRLTAASSSHPQPLADDTDPAGSHRKPRRASKRLEEAGRSRAPDQCATLRRRCSGLRAIRVQRWRAADPGLIPPTSLTAPDPRIFVRQDALTPATSPSSTTDTIAKAVHLQRDPSIQRRCAARGLAVALLRGVRSLSLPRCCNASVPPQGDRNMRHKLFQTVIVSVASLSVAGVLAAQTGDRLRIPAGFQHWYLVNSLLVTKDNPQFDTTGGLHHVYVNDTGLARLKKGG